MSRKPLAVSPDVFCTPAVRRYESVRREDGQGGREGREGADRAGQLSGGKKLGLAAGRGGLGHRSTSPPTGGSILAVRDPNVLRAAPGPASAKRVSFKDVPLMSPEEGASRPKARSAGERGLVLPPLQHPGASGGERVASPGPWTELIEDMAPEESFTHYLNPLADGEEGREAESLEGLVEIQQHSPMSQLSRAVDTATSRGVAFHMQTPEAVQVLHKISLHTKGRLDKGSLDRYLRTGPKKLSPEPGMALLSAGTEGDAADPRVGGMATLESSEDENVVDEGVVETRCQQTQLVLASPIGRGRLVADAEEAADLDEVPPTFQLGRGLKTSGRVTSPVRFSLLGESPDSYAENSDVEDARGSGSNGRSFSFGIGGGGDAEATAELLDVPCDRNQENQEDSVDQPNPFGEMLGKLREDPDQLQSPVLRAIVKDAGHQGSLAGSPESPANCTPMNLISTSSAASLQDSGHRNASGAQGALDGTRSNGSGGRDDGQIEDVLSESSSLDEWLRQRGIKHLSTPTRSDLEKMWDALANIRETTEAYADATRENAQLREQLWETREAELNARDDLEEALEVVRIEQERSRDAACKMAELAMSMHQQFAMLEEERRNLQSDLEQARKMLDASAGESAANVMQEIDDLKAELERLRVAEQAERLRVAEQAELERSQESEQAARADAMGGGDRVSEGHRDQGSGLFSEAFSRALNDPVKSPEDEAVAEEEERDDASLGHAVEVVHAALDAGDAGEFGFSEEGSAAQGDVQCKVKFFERLKVDELGAGPTQPRDDAISPACPQTGIRAPRTTPVDADDTTTPYRIHVETMNQFRNTWNDPAETAPEMAGTDREDPEDSGSDLSDYQVEDIVVSPIDVEDLTRSNLRQTVMQRIAAVKSDLASARSRLGHAQSGFRGRGDRASAASKDGRGGGLETTHGLRGGERSSGHYPSPLPPPSTINPAEEPAAGPAALYVITEEAGDVPGDTGDTEHPLTPDSFAAAAAANALAADGLEDDVFDEGVDEDVDFGDAEGGPAPASQSIQSGRSVFARRLDAMSTPLSLRKVVFTPKRGVSLNESLRSTAHASPRFSSSSSISSSSTPLPPSYLQRTVASRPAPRTRRFGGIGREPSADEDREFRRRAAALNIHVSPYMKRAGRRQMATN